MPARNGLGGPITVGDQSKQPKGRIVIICAAAFVLQVFLAPNIAIAGISPNLLLLALAWVCLDVSEAAGAVVGFVLGLLFDLLGSGPVGAMALSMAVAGYMLCGMGKSVFAESFASWIAIVAVACVAVNVVYCVLAAITGAESQFFAALLFKVLPWTAYDVVVGALMWLIVGRGRRPRPGGLGSKVKL